MDFHFNTFEDKRAFCLQLAVEVNKDGAHITLELAKQFYEFITIGPEAPKPSGINIVY